MLEKRTDQLQALSAETTGFMISGGEVGYEPAASGVDGLMIDRSCSTRMAVDIENGRRAALRTTVEVFVEVRDDAARSGKKFSLERRADGLEAIVRNGLSGASSCALRIIKVSATRTACNSLLHQT